MTPFVNYHPLKKNFLPLKLKILFFEIDTICLWKYLIFLFSYFILKKKKNNFFLLGELAKSTQSNISWLILLLLFVLVGILNIVWFGWKSLCDHVVFFVLRHFWIVELFGMKLGQCWWLMKLGIVCSLWYCWMNLDLNVVDIGIIKNWCVGMVEQTHFWWMRKFCWNV